MKFVTFAAKNKERIGVVKDGFAVDLAAAYSAYLKSRGVAGYKKKAHMHIPSTMKDFIKQGNQGLEVAKSALNFAEEKEYKLRNAVFPLEKVKLKAPLPNPSKIVCTGLNFEDYRKILNLQYLPVPQIFLKAPSSIIGHMDAIVIPDGYGAVYHEFEFSCVISKKCKNVPKEKVHEVIFGYTILNDITAHDIELISREYQQWAKSFDTFAPMGPWIVTPDQMPKDIYNLKMIRRRNGKVECESNTKHMRFRFDDIISFTTTFWTLEPGDIVTSASPPAGPIEPGDIIEAEVEGIGVLRNPVVKLSVTTEYAKRIGMLSKTAF